MYYDNPSSLSPGSHRHPPQALHSQPSRRFDAYGTLTTTTAGGLYPPEDQTTRFDAPRYNNDRVGTVTQSNYGSYDPPDLQTWNTSGFGQNNNNNNNSHTLAAIGTSSRMKSTSRNGRSVLPSGWLDQPQLMSSISQFPGLGSSALSPVPAPMRPEALSSDTDEELIPTAIVIKNIPFAVKKEQLVQLMTELQLPLPYAFNYHFDNGVFRGLAFANFTTPEETSRVIETMNHFDLYGRKLRVEYKKMLPLVERERIEREKRERRGQLEEQHRPIAQLHNQTSMSSLSSHYPVSSPSPVSVRAEKPEVDFNVPKTLQLYSKLLLFKGDATRESMAMPPTLSPMERRVVHTIAHRLGLGHMSKGIGDQRQVHVYHVQGPNMSPPQVSQMPSNIHGDPHRRGLNRAATTDFSDVRSSEKFHGTVGRQSSVLLGFPDSPGGLTAAPNLRAAKSYADLRSYSPSPVPSTASFPTTLNINFNRLTEYGSNATPSNY